MELSKHLDHTLATWLVLLHAPQVGPITCNKLIQHFGSADAVLAASRDELGQIGIKPSTYEGLKNPDWKKVERELKWGTLPGHTILCLDDPAYPSLLREISDPPPVLFVVGKVEALSSMQIAIVGSRHPTNGGKKNAFDFSRYLSTAGLTITSGLALGIDEQAHLGTLETNASTIAVMGNGLNTVYPAKHRALAEQIAHAGALVSEFPPETAPMAKFFPRRNRIISGLSMGVLVVEATRKSGSLITARHAANQGREVFALPGSIHNTCSKGCHQLIKNGAKLVETAEDILEELNSLASFINDSRPRAPTVDNSTLGVDYQLLLENVGYEPTSIDVLVGRCRLTPESVSSMLLILELEGYVVSQSGGRYYRI